MKLPTSLWSFWQRPRQPQATNALPFLRTRAHAGQMGQGGSWFILGGVLGVLWACVALAPARWLSPWLLAASGQRVTLVQTQGRIWQGEAHLLLASERREWHALPGRWTWQIQFGWTGGLHVRLQLQSECCLAQALTWRWFPLHSGRWTLEASAGQFELAWLQVLGSPWNTLGLQGQMRWQSQDLSGQLNWRQAEVHQGAAVVHINQLSSALSPIQPLGRYHVNITAQPQARFSFQTDQGPLHITGEGQWVKQRWRFQGQALAQDPHGEALQPVLSLLGQRRGSQAELTF